MNRLRHDRFPHTRDTLLAEPADCGSGCEAAIPAPDASQRRVMASHPRTHLPEGEGYGRLLREIHVKPPALPEGVHLNFIRRLLFIPFR